MNLFAFSLPSILYSSHALQELGLIAVIAILYMAIATLWEKWKKYRTRSWPTSAGSIANLEAKKVDGGLNGVDYWKVTIQYAYSIGREHKGSYSFNCTDEELARGAVAGLEGKTVCVHYKPSDESNGLLWEDEIWDLWWDTYRERTHRDTESTPG